MTPDPRSPGACRPVALSLVILSIVGAHAPASTHAGPAPLPGLATIKGKVEFEAAYDGVLGGTGQVPDGHSSMPYVYVCAWDEDGGTIDFKYTEFPQEYGDDDLLGCAKTDTQGSYTISVTNTDELPDVYLETKLCNDVHRGAQSAADVCVRINAPEGSEDTSSNVKAIWSRLYTNVTGPIATISWNLSCPNKDGRNRSSLTCTTSEVEPDDWGNSCPCDGYPDLSADTCPVKCSGANCGDTNSRTGCNKEAVHAFRAAVEPFKTWGTNKPDSGSTYAKSCPDSSGDDHCDTDECQDEIKFHLARIQLDLAEDHVAGGGVANCNPAATNNGAEDYDDTCIVTPLNAFRVVHELGHVVDMRWRCDGSGHGNADAVADTLWERRAVREGFANFVAVSAWFNADATDPVYCGSTSACTDMESAVALYAFDRGEEEAVTQFLWDLRDESDDGGTEMDTERSTLQQIRNIWSAFPYGTDDMETREGYDSSDSEDGANVWDFSYHWQRKRGVTASYCELMALDRVDEHERCESCASICP